MKFECFLSLIEESSETSKRPVRIFFHPRAIDHAVGKLQETPPLGQMHSGSQVPSPIPLRRPHPIVLRHIRNFFKMRSNGSNGPLNAAEINAPESPLCRFFAGVIVHEILQRQREFDPPASILLPRHVEHPLDCHGICCACTQAPAVSRKDARGVFVTAICLIYVHSASVFVLFVPKKQASKLIYVHKKARKLIYTYIRFVEAEGPRLGFGRV